MHARLSLADQRVTVTFGSWLCASCGGQLGAIAAVPLDEASECDVQLPDVCRDRRRCIDLAGTLALVRRDDTFAGSGLSC